MWTLNLLNLSCSSATFLYEGSPFYPRPTILLEYAEKLGYRLQNINTNVELC